MPHEPLPILPTFERTGECNRFCGHCCSLLHWQQHPLYVSQIKAIVEAPPFIGMNEQGECNHLQWERGMAVCKIYDTRPEICRVFPNHPRSVDTIPTCTFQFHAHEAQP